MPMDLWRLPKATPQDTLTAPGVFNAGGDVEHRKVTPLKPLFEIIKCNDAKSTARRSRQLSVGLKVIVLFMSLFSNDSSALDLFGGRWFAQDTPRYLAGIVSDRRFVTSPTTHHSGDQLDRHPLEHMSQSQPIDRLPQGPLKIRRIMEDSPASRAGLRPGDLIVRFAGVPITSHDALLEAVQASRGEASQVEVLRDGDSYELRIQPTVRPSDYRERVFRERAQENAELTARATKSADPTSSANKRRPTLLDLFSLVASQDDKKKSDSDRSSQQPLESDNGSARFSNPDKSIDRLSQHSDTDATQLANPDNSLRVEREESIDRREHSQEIEQRATTPPDHEAANAAVRYLLKRLSALSDRR